MLPGMIQGPLLIFPNVITAPELTILSSRKAVDPGFGEELPKLTPFGSFVTRAKY
jgi:hypothetical protein